MILKKHKILRNLTCFYIALKSIQGDRRIVLAFFLINFLRYHAICSNDNNFTLATDYGQSFSDHGNSRKENESGSTFQRIPSHTCNG